MIRSAMIGGVCSCNIKFVTFVASVVWLPVAPAQLCTQWTLNLPFGQSCTYVHIYIQYKGCFHLIPWNFVGLYRTSCMCAITCLPVTLWTKFVPQVFDDTREDGGDHGLALSMATWQSNLGPCTREPLFLHQMYHFCNLTAYSRTDTVRV